MILDDPWFSVSSQTMGDRSLIGTITQIESLLREHLKFQKEQVELQQKHLQFLMSSGTIVAQGGFLGEGIFPEKTPIGGQKGTLPLSPEYASPEFAIPVSPDNEVVKVLDCFPGAVDDIDEHLVPMRSVSVFSAVSGSSCTHTPRKCLTNSFVEKPRSFSKGTAGSAQSNRSVSSGSTPKPVVTSRTSLRASVSGNLSRASSTIAAPIIDQLNEDQTNVSAYMKRDLRRLVTQRAFTYFAGTVLKDGDVLRGELVFELFLFFTIGGIVTVANWGKQDPPELLKIGTYKNLFEVVNLLVMPIVFLLGGYLGLSISRWADIRGKGIGTIWNNTLRFVFWMSTLVTSDPEVLDKCRRYGRASLVFLFLVRHQKSGHTKEIDFEKVPLNDEERRTIEQATGSQAEIMWVWMGNIVRQQWQAGKITDANMYVFLLGLIDEGRSAISFVYAQLGTPLPWRYAHLLCLLVKLHNAIVGACGGVVLGAWIVGFQHDQPMSIIAFIKTLVHVIVMPTVFNAVLILCMEMQFPVDGSSTSDFPMLKFDLAMDMGCQHMEKVPMPKSWNVRRPPK